MSNTKEELAKILKEHDQLTNQHTMEEKKMGKNLKENEAELTELINALKQSLPN